MRLLSLYAFNNADKMYSGWMSSEISTRGSSENPLHSAKVSSYYFLLKISVFESCRRSWDLHVQLSMNLGISVCCLLILKSYCNEERFNINIDLVFWNSLMTNLLWPLFWIRLWETGPSDEIFCNISVLPASGHFLVLSFCLPSSKFLNSKKFLVRKNYKSAFRYVLFWC